MRAGVDYQNMTLFHRLIIPGEHVGEQSKPCHFGEGQEGESVWEGVCRGVVGASAGAWGAELPHALGAAVPHD